MSAIIKKVLWGTFVALSGLFTACFVEKGLKTVYNPSEDKKNDETAEPDGEDGQGTNEPTGTANEPTEEPKEEEVADNG